MDDAEIKIEFTRHALKKLKHRTLREQDVIKAILKPEKLVLDKNRFNAFRKFGKLYLKVVFVRLGDVAIVITQHLTDKLK